MLGSVNTEDNVSLLDSVFFHEIGNLISRLKLTNTYIYNIEKTEKDINWFIEKTDKNLKALVYVLDSYKKFRNNNAVTECYLESSDFSEITSNIINNLELNITSKHIVIIRETEGGFQLINKLVDNKPRVDTLLLYLLLSNLIDNAVRYSPEDSVIKLKAGCTNTGCYLRVENSGIVSQYLQENFFSPNKKEYNGSGYGLYFCKILADLMQLRISCEFNNDKVSVLIQF